MTLKFETPIAVDFHPVKVSFSLEIPDVWYANRSADHKLRKQFCYNFCCEYGGRGEQTTCFHIKFKPVKLKSWPNFHIH